MSRVIIPVVLLVAGLAIGCGVSTVFWVGIVDRGYRAQAEWKQIADRMEAVARKNQAGWKECLTITERIRGNQ